MKPSARLWVCTSGAASNIVENCRGRGGTSLSLLSLSTPLSDVSSSVGVADSWTSRFVQTFFTCLACGDDLPPLIRSIRSHLRQLPQGTLENQSVLSASTNAADVKAAPGGIPSESQELHQESQTALMNSHQDELLLRRAAKVALMFSVESDRAQYEATRLLYEPAVARLVQRAAKPDVNVAMRLPQQYHHLLLNDRVVVDCARRWAQEGCWELGLELLAQADSTATTTAAAVELFCHAGRWDMAMRCLGRIAPTSWTEREVSTTVRSLYRISQEERRNTRTGGVFVSGWWRHALSILTLVYENNVRLSAPSAVNDALGLLGVDGQHWVAACRLVEGMLLFQRDEALAEKLEGKVRPNVVSIYHMCSALRRHWYLALHYAFLMMHRGDVKIVDDRGVTNRLLNFCVSSNHWGGALYIIQQFLDKGVKEEGTDDTNCVGVDIFLRVLGMLNECQKGHLALRLFQQSQLSRHFSNDITSKAYNTLLRYCNTVTESQLWLQTMKAKDVVVENESYEHLIMLHSREGDWQQALSLFNILLSDPQRCHLYIPSAKAHDAVQYALERAQTPGPSWEVSLALFIRVSALHVPFSEVAFQSAVKICFAQGRTEQAQSLFEFMMRLGVHR